MRALLIALFFCVSAVAQTAPRNILFILVDDMGWTGATSYGSDLHMKPSRSTS